MAISWQQAADRLDQAAAILNDDTPVKVTGPLYAGIDLGTADVVLMVLDASGAPVACFLQWAEVVRDGVVVDFVGALDIVRGMVAKAEAKLSTAITRAATSYPPGTDARLSTNILETANLDVVAVLDEPSCVAALLHLDRAAVVDVGGGTTGTAVVRAGQVVFSDDEPTGGTHLSLAIAGHYGIPFEAAEARKLQAGGNDILTLAHPIVQRISDIVAAHIKGYNVDRILLSGGTCCLPGIDTIFAKELDLEIVLPNQPLLLTPLAIASLALATEAG